MNERYYRILNCTESSTDEEIKASYESLKAKYSEERFLEGEAGNFAAKQLTEIETAYAEIMAQRKISSGPKGQNFEEVEQALKSGDTHKAQLLLDDFTERTAEWHYLQSVVFYKKNWSNESKKQLEIAMNMDPFNAKYKSSYEKLVSQINANNGPRQENPQGQQQWNRSGNGQPEMDAPQMGGDGCIDFCCQMILCNTLLNCCCNCR